MFCFKALLLLGTCLSWSLAKLNGYCSICDDHTMCKFEGIGAACENVGASGVTYDEQQEIVGVHNWVRKIVASGYEARGADGPQPKAANMRKLIWDEDLAKVAQRWADQCKFQHDTCRNDPRWDVGQNIFWKWKYPTHQVNWTEAILSWYDEVSLYNPKEVEAYRFEAATGHYTQMLWHDTYAVGCGRRDYGPNKLYVCNYGPAGNWVGEALYAVGEPCSQCPRGTYCSEYLCDFQNRTQAPRTEKPGNKSTDAKTGTRTPAKEDKLTLKTIDDEDLVALTPPKENASDSYGSEPKVAQPSKAANKTRHGEAKPEREHNTLNDVLLNAEGPTKTTTNAVDEEEDIELDQEIKRGVEEIKIRIENLLKKLIKKLGSNKA